MASEERGLVAITGANGTIGYASVLHALRTGYCVRCIVRREDAISEIKAGPSLKKFADKVEYAIVPDNTLPGAYDKALKEVDFVVHVAGVWPKPNYHPDNEIWIPFVKSMENILSASKKSGTVKRVVFTQAGAGLVNPDDGDTLGTAMDKILDEYVKPNAASAAFRPPLKSPHHAYCGAKAYCMTYLKDLKTKGDLPFSVAQVIPGTVMGPSELVKTAEDAKKHMDRMSTTFLFNTPKPRYAFGFVHVDDCARVHVEALDSSLVPDSDLPDWFVAAATTEPTRNGIEEIWFRVADVVKKTFPEEVANDTFKIGRENWPINVPFRVDSGKTEKMLMGGGKFKSLSECVMGIGEWYLGLLEKETRTLK
ncbi:hypothetical protein BDV96DRAFT_590122 [Lophiotrema nucula]|uniref:NAD-dependent epimerase/dehydratase domain-containing protein n=1 Tax=Lophiotrema nucula TaxID=690887 RepID=A0A6A5YKZ3_9PLEO|nr:hypothetical protein BDV96DRAFT_590122 [Lophiotrema nucula]